MKKTQFVLILFLILICQKPAMSDEAVTEDTQGLVNVEKMVAGLRVKFGIKGSVHLSRTTWQILNSFPTEEQASQLWETALEKATELKEDNNHSIVNVRYSVGQILSLYTNGMNRSSWTQDRVYESIQIGTLDDYFKLSDDLKIYANLNHIWKLLLKEIENRDDLQWPVSFDQSFDAMIESELITLDEIDQLLLDIDTELSGSQLSQIFNSLDQLTLSHGQSNYYLTLVRFKLSLHSQQYLGSVNAWMVLADFWVHESAEFFNSTGLIEEFIEKVDQWFLESSEGLSNSDVDLPQIVQLSMQKLRNNLFQSNSESVNLPTAFDLISTPVNDYMLSPFRKEIQTQLEVCLDMSREFAPYPQEPISIHQFEGCLNDLNSWIKVDAKSRELSGDVMEDVSEDKMIRFLRNPSWQIINAIQNYHSDETCLSEENQLVNPFEWIIAAETLMWFADRWPSYFQGRVDVENNIVPQKLIEAFVLEGEKLNQGFTCSEPPEKLIEKQFKNIIKSWEDVKSNVNELKMDHSAQQLKTSSDIDLLLGVQQKSDYRVEGATIGPCNESSVCGVYADLDASRNLFNLFPNHLLIADQLKMGELKICYDQIGWDNRKSAATHLENENVANYIGTLSVHLKGFFNEELVFERKITSRNETLYLFAKNDEEVMNLYCPQEIVGEMITTTLKRGTFGLVPNRLTFLTASRADETKILKDNWQAGEEWQDKFAQQDVAEVLAEDSKEELIEEVQNKYLSLSSELQEKIYQSLIGSEAELTEAQLALKASLDKYLREVRLLSSIFELHSWDDFLTNDKIHGLFFGTNRIPNRSTFVQLYTQQVGVSDMLSKMDEQLNQSLSELDQQEYHFQHKMINEVLFRLKSRIQ